MSKTGIFSPADEKGIIMIRDENWRVGWKILEGLKS